MTVGSTIFTALGPDVISRKRGGGRRALLGLPFFLAGLFVAQIPFGIIPYEVEGGPLVLAIILPLGPLFAGVGLILVLSRSGLIIDRRTNSVTQWWGLIVPMKRTEYELDRFTKVRIEFQAGDRRSPDTFQISLVGPGPHTSFYIADIADCELAVKEANDLARFTGKPLEDLATEPERQGHTQGLSGADT